MKKYKVKNELAKSLLQENVVFHDDVIEEIEELVVKTGLVKEFIKLWNKNIAILCSLGKDAIKSSNFEILQGTGGLYSMKFKGKNFNWRMLYSYDEVNEKIMLHFFYEKDDSNRGRYEQHIPIAQQRKNEMEEKNEK